MIRGCETNGKQFIHGSLQLIQKSHDFEKMTSQYYVQNALDKENAQLVSGLPYWFRSLRTPHYCNGQQ